MNTVMDRSILMMICYTLDDAEMIELMRCKVAGLQN